MDAELKEILETMRAESAATTSSLRNEMGSIREMIGSFQQETREAIASLQQQTSSMAEAIASLQQETSSLRNEMGSMREHFTAMHVDTRRHFDVVAEGLRSDIRLVAEGHLTTNARIDRLEEVMKEEFSEARALLDLSHGDLDKRVRKLEDADLETRVERLERRRTH